MKCYADSSFLVQMLVPDFASLEAGSFYRSLGRPALLFCPLHELEVFNALHLRVVAAKEAGARHRAAARQEVQTALRMLKSMCVRGYFRSTR